MGLFTRYAMDALMKTSHPEVIRRQCWNLHPHRTPCTACKDICPYGDAIFTRPNLVKDWDPCTDCGLCVSACRSGCIVPSPEQVQRDTSLADTDNDTLWLGCEKSTRKNTAVRACVASFSWETLAYLALNKKLVLDLTPCGECENDVCAAQLRKELTRLVEFLGPQLFESRVTLAYEQDEAPYHVQELSRREMFSHMTEGSRAGTKKLLQMLPGLRSEEDSAADFRLMLHQRTKQLKAASETPLRYGWYLPNFTQKCFGCGKCEKACRSGALKLEDMPDGQTRVVITPWKCSECGVCVAACSNSGIDGMKLRQLTTLGPVSVYKCSKTLCADCGKPICTDETIKAVSDLFAEKGSNAWFDMEAADILPKGFTCPHCGKNAGFTKEEDTLDGWFDSGSTHFASMKKDQGFWPATMYLEGLDQYRGWFQSSLLTAVGAFGQGAPFKECVTHGWTVDGEGKAMHKSLGNGVDPADVFNENGADILRLWAASADYHADVRCSKEIFKQLSQNYLKFRNTCKFMLDNLVDFDPEKLTKPEEMPKLDRWLLTKLNELIEKTEQSYCDYEFHIITHAVNDFCVTTLSSFYLDIVKDRLYCDGADSLSRRSAQTALYLTLHTLSKLFAPILAFTCDEIWLAMPHTGEDDARNVVLNEMNKPFTAYALTAEEMANWEKLAEVRTVVNGVLEAARAEKKIGKSLEADVHLTVPAEDAFLANVDGKELADLLIVSQVEVTVGDSVKASAEEAAGTKCPRCWKHSTAANAEGLCPRCAEVMRSFPDLA